MTNQGLNPDLTAVLDMWKKEAQWIWTEHQFLGCSKIPVIRLDSNNTYCDYVFIIGDSLKSNGKILTLYANGHALIDFPYDHLEPIKTLLKALAND